MKAVVVRGLCEVAVEAVEAPARMEAPTDILLRVTSSAICGTDLHIWTMPALGCVDSKL
jgi:glutathione-independent formaldehyde dehydrogenase